MKVEDDHTSFLLPFWLSDISYIPFITLGTTPGVDTQTLPVIDDGASDPIPVQGGFPIGMERFFTAYVRRV